MSKVIGATVGTTAPRPNWNQTDPSKADFIKNKPEVIKSLPHIEITFATLEESQSATLEAIREKIVKVTGDEKTPCYVSISNYGEFIVRFNTDFVPGIYQVYMLRADTLRNYTNSAATSTTISAFLAREASNEYYQRKNDSSLLTSNKKIADAINEVHEKVTAIIDEVDNNILVFNETIKLNLSLTRNYTFSFKVAGSDTEYKSIGISQTAGGNVLYYSEDYGHQLYVYASTDGYTGIAGWQKEEYRRIEVLVTPNTNSELSLWLDANTKKAYGIVSTSELGEYQKKADPSLVTDDKTIVGAINELANRPAGGGSDADLSNYQTKTDESLETTDKTVVGAINELKESIDSAGGGTPNSGTLPKGYTEVEYIESTGTQYIDTGVSGDNDNLTISVKYNMLSHKNYAGVFGNYVNESSNCWRLILTNADNTNCYANSNTSPASATITVQIEKNAINTVVYDKNQIVINGVATAISKTTKGTTNNTNIALFGQKLLGGLSLMRLYRCKIFDSGTLIRDFVPCVNEINDVGLYDLIGGVFYRNIGSGSFVSGSVVSHTEEMPIIRFANQIRRVGYDPVWEENPLALTVEIVGGGKLQAGDTLQLCRRKKYNYKVKSPTSGAVTGRKTKKKLQCFAECTITEFNVDNRFLTLHVTNTNQKENFALNHSDNALTGRVATRYLRIRRPKGDLQNNNSGRTVDAIFSNVVPVKWTYTNECINIL